MRAISITPFPKILRWILTISVIAFALALIYPLHNNHLVTLEDIILLLALTCVPIVLLANYFLTFPYGIAIIHRGIRSAAEGKLRQIKTPRRMRFIFGPVIQDYNMLVHNMVSLFGEMELSQLSVISDRNRNDAILRSLPGTLITVDSDFRVTLTNKQAEQLFDLCSNDLLGKNLFELLSLNEEGRGLLREAFLYEQQINNKEIVLSVGNTSRYFTLNITFFRQSQYDNECCAAVMLQDITEYKRLQDLILQSEKFLAIGKLAGGVAHELNTPLGTIVGYAQLLNEGVESNVKRLQYGQEIYREAKRCSVIVENLRTISQRVVCRTESCEINSVIHEVIETINSCPGKKHNVRIETGLATNAIVQGSGGELDIVLVNVIMNAVQAAAGSASAPLVTIVTGIRNDSVLISVTDNGPGIPRPQQVQVFDPFFSTKPDGSGLGLGLAISQSIVTRIGGSLCCDPDYVGGARFIMTLPMGTRRAE